MSGEKINPIFAFIWRNIIINLIVIVTIAICITVYVFWGMDKYYTANASVIPSSSNFASNFGGKINALAGLAGLGSIGSGGRSQEMYEGIIHSRKLQVKLLETKFEFEDENRNRNETLIQFFKIEAKSQRQLLEKALKLLNENVIYTEIDAVNNILYISVTLKNPFLAAKVANQIIDYLDQIVQNQINNEYIEQYNYLQERIATIEDSIKIDENNLKIFLEHTRDLNSPQNMIKEMRLRREIMTHTSIFAELRKQEEVYVLENMVNLTPVKILDSAIPPYRKSRPKRLMILISFLIISIFLLISINMSVVLYRRLKYDYLPRI